MSIPTSVPVFDLQAFDESPLSLQFVCQMYNPDGTPVEPQTFLDLTNKVIRVHIAGSYNPPLDFTSDAGTTNGSTVEKGDYVSEAGTLHLYLCEADLRKAKGTGHWYMQAEETGQDELVLMRGSFTVKSLITGETL